VLLGIDCGRVGCGLIATTSATVTESDLWQWYLCGHRSAAIALEEPVPRGSFAARHGII